MVIQEQMLGCNIKTFLQVPGVLDHGLIYQVGGELGTCRPPSNWQLRSRILLSSFAVHIFFEIGLIIVILP